MHVASLLSPCVGFIKQVMSKAPYVQLDPVIALSGMSVVSVDCLRLLHVFLSMLWNF